jgi:hypothetical protein
MNRINFLSVSQKISLKSSKLISVESGKHIFFPKTERKYADAIP